MSLPPTFAKDLADVALNQHAKFSGLAEDNPKLCNQIKLYWTNLGFSFTSCTTVPWSAVFVSWCVKEAGAKSSQFKFAASHSEFVHEAIKNALSGTGEFRAFEITKHAPKVGDIIQNNREARPTTMILHANMPLMPLIRRLSWKLAWIPAGINSHAR